MNADVPSRFIDYVVVCTKREETIGDGSDDPCNGGRWETKLKVNARFPEEDWDDAPFPNALPLFCLPTTEETVESCLSGGDGSKDIAANEALTFPFVLTQADGSHVFGTCLLHAVANGEGEERASEALCIVSKWPMFSLFESCLRWSHDVAFKAESWGSVQALRVVEEFFSKLVALVLPPTALRVQINLKSDGLATVQESIGRDRIGHSLPLVDHSCYYVLADHFDEDNIVHILESMIMEQKILIHGEVLGDITKISEALLSLLYPLQWPFVYIPLVPPSLVDYLHAPLPFVMGIHSSNFLMESVIPVMPQCVVVNLDQKVVIDPMQLRPLPGAKTWNRENDTETIPSFPPELSAAVKSHLKNAIRTIRNRSEAPAQSIVDEAVRVMRSAGLSLIISLLHGASECMKAPPVAGGGGRDAPCCREIFDADQFLHKQLLDGTNMMIINATFDQPGSIGLSIVKSPTGYGIVGGGKKGIRGQARAFDIMVGDVLVAVNRRSVLNNTYREMIQKIIKAGRPVELTFGRIKDKYTAHQFYGNDIPSLASFAMVISPDSFSSNFASPTRELISLAKSRCLRWNMDAESLHFMVHFCASQVFATVVEDSLYPMKNGHVNTGMNIYSNGLQILKKARESNTDAIMDMAFSDAIFYLTEPSDVVMLKMDDVAAENGGGSDSKSDAATESAAGDKRASGLDETAPSPLPTRQESDTSTPGEEGRRRRTRRPTFTAMNLQSFSSPSAAGSASPARLRARPSFRARFSVNNQHLEPMWQTRPSTLSNVSDSTDGGLADNEGSFYSTSTPQSSPGTKDPPMALSTPPAVASLPLPGRSKVDSSLKNLVIEEEDEEEEETIDDL